MGSYARMPLAFEANQGQADSHIQFFARGQGYSVALLGTETVLTLKGAAVGYMPWTKGQKFSTKTQVASVTPPIALRIGFAGAGEGVYSEGLDPLPGVSNYFIGKDPSRWRTRVPHYAKVLVRDVYPGVDVVYYGNQGKLEYDLRVKPGADPAIIRMTYEGADEAAVDGEGNLKLTFRDQSLTFKAPVLYQEDGVNRTSVRGKYVTRAKGEFGFEVENYDARMALTIDPALDYSSYLGGTGSDQGFSIATDAAGNAYITGATIGLYRGIYYFGTPTPLSNDFPTTPGSFQPVAPGNQNAFVTKISPDGSTLVYSTYLGGTTWDEGSGIAVDAAGEAYVTGSTGSADFPTTPGAYQGAFGGGVGLYSYPSDAFVSKLSGDGSSLLYSTYLGGSGDDFGMAIALDALGKAYLTGQAGPNFPTIPGAYQTNSTDNETFLAKINPGGGGAGDLLYSSYIATTAADPTQSGGGGGSVAVDSSGNAFLTGYTLGNFPTTPGSFQPAFNGGSSINTPGSDAFIAEVRPAGAGNGDLLYSTFLGGTDNDYGNGIALDAMGNVFVTGTTGSSDYPTTSGVFQSAPNGSGSAVLNYRFYGVFLFWFGGIGGSDAFVAKLRPAGTGAGDLVYSTCLGGSSGESGNSIAVDGCGNAYVTGATSSTDFPITSDAAQVTYGGITTLGGGIPYTFTIVEDAFLSEISPDGSTLLYSTYLGGSGEDEGYGVALDGAGNVYSTGETYQPQVYYPVGCPSCPIPIAVRPKLPPYPPAYPSTSNDFPITGGVFQALEGGSGDAFAVKFQGFTYCAPSPTNTPTNTATNSPTPTATSTATSTPTPTGTSSATSTASPSPTQTPTNTPTLTSSNTATATATLTTTATPTLTSTATATNTPTFTSTPTATSTPTRTPTSTFTPLLTSTFTQTPTATPGSETFFVSKNLLQGGSTVTIHTVTWDYPGAFALKIYNSAGEYIKSLDDGNMVGPLDRSYTWDGTNRSGEPCASGMYIIYWTHPYGAQMARILLIR